MTRKDIEKASVIYQMSTRPMAIGGDTFNDMVYRMNINPSFIAGAKYVLNNLWKPADGEDLPEIDKPVIVLTQPYPLEGSEYCVSFAHRPNLKELEKEDISTEALIHYVPETYGKGEWNIPDVKWWLDLDIPK